LSDRVEAFEGAGVHALPVAGLLSQFEVVPAQRSYLGAQLGQFGPQQVEECVSFAGVRLDAALFEQESSHHARKVARPAQSGKDGKVTAGKRTGWAKLYSRRAATPLTKRIYRKKCISRSGVPVVQLLSCA